MELHTGNYFKSNNNTYTFYSEEELKDPRNNIYAFIFSKQFGDTNKYYVKLGMASNSIKKRYKTVTAAREHLKNMIKIWEFTGTDTPIHNYLRTSSKASNRGYTPDKDIKSNKETYELTDETGIENFIKDVEYIIGQKSVKVQHELKLYPNVNEVVNNTLDKIKNGTKISILDLCPRFGKTHTGIQIHSKYFAENPDRRIYIIASYVATVKQSYMDTIGKFYPNNKFIDGNEDCDANYNKMKECLEENNNNIITYYLQLTGSDEGNTKIFEERTKALKKIKSNYKFGGIIIEEADFGSACPKQTKKINSLLNNIDIQYVIATSGTNSSKMHIIAKALKYDIKDVYYVKRNYIMDVLNNDERPDSVGLRCHTLNNKYMINYGFKPTNFEHISSMLAVENGHLRDEVYFKQFFKILFRETSADTDVDRNQEIRERKRKTRKLLEQDKPLLDLNYATMIFLGGETPKETHEATAKLLKHLLPDYIIRILNSDNTTNADAEAIAKGDIARTNGSNKVIFITTGMANRSFSIPEIKNIVLLTGNSSSSDSIQQKISRGLTPTGEKDVFCNIVDLRLNPCDTSSIEKFIFQAYLEDEIGLHNSSKKYLTEVEYAINKERLIFDEYFVDGNTPFRKASFNEIKNLFNSSIRTAENLNIIANDFIRNYNFNTSIPKPTFSINLTRNIYDNSNIESASDKIIKYKGVGNSLNKPLQNNKMSSDEKNLRKHTDIALYCNTIFRTYQYKTVKEQINAFDANDISHFKKVYNIDVNIIKDIINKYEDIEFPWTNSVTFENAPIFIKKLCANHDYLIEKFLEKTGNLNGKDVLLLSLNSPFYTKELLERYPNVNSISLIEYDKLRNLFKFNYKIMKFYKNEKDILENLKGMNMKFDCIIMNPPYDGDLHVKILKEAREHLNDNGICVNLSPNLYTNYKTCKNFDMLPISYEIIDRKSMCKLFNGIQLNDDGMISVWGKNTNLTVDDIKKQFIPTSYPIVKRLKFNKTFADVNKLDYNNENFFVPLKLMTSKWDKNKNSIVDKIGLIKNGFVKNEIPYKDARKKNKDRPCGGIPFESENEAINFMNSCETLFFKFIVQMQHIHSRYVLKEYPFMEDYSQPWTDERFYQFFNITPEEQKIIEETMAKYSAS